MQQWRKAAAGGETTLSGTDDFATSLSYVVGAEQVFINGVLLERGVDYTATTGTSITGLTALVAGDIATVVSPSSFAVANAIPLSTVTAKGDLITATGASTVTNLAVGADGSTLVANSSAGAGVSWQPAKTANGIINGGMDIWQRSTSQTAGTSGYLTADRYYLNNAGATGFTFNQGASDLTGFRYFGRLQRASGNATTTAMTLGYTLETSESLRFAGQTVTFSFYARKGANYSMGAFPVTLYYGTGTDQRLYSFTGLTAVATSPNFSPTTSWVRYSQTVTIPSTATELGFEAFFSPTGTAGAADYIDLTGFQLELGSVATAFSRAGGTLQGELQACMRYYYRWTANATYSRYPVSGLAASTTLVFFPSITPVPLRAAPTAVESSSNWRVYDGASVVTGVTIGMVVSTEAELQPYLTATVSSGLTQYRPYMLTANNDASAYIGLSAEL